MDKIVPVFVLSGFLGSGKTTLLMRLLRHYKELGQRPAVIMNEMGEVNLDGVLLDEHVPMSELLNGCICCTISSDLSMALKTLVEENSPDLIIIESTGVANPMEVMDAVTEASLLMKIKLELVLTVVDAVSLLQMKQKGKGKTYRLMQDQIRCASILVLNKTDCIKPGEHNEIESMIAEWNSYAPILSTYQCQFNFAILDQDKFKASPSKIDKVAASSCDHDHHHHHHSHDHVMVLTEYMDKPVSRMAFEQLMYNLPEQVYRGKGILRFTDTPGRFMYQYAYQALNVYRIEPQGEVPDVMVFIGEHFSEREIQTALEKL